MSVELFKELTPKSQMIATWCCWESAQNEPVPLLQISSTSVPAVSKALSQLDSEQLRKLAKRRTDTRGRHASAVSWNLWKHGHLEPTETVILGWEEWGISWSPKGSSRRTTSRHQQPAFEETAEGGSFSSS